MIDRIMTLKEVGEALHYTPVHINRLVRAGEFPAPLKIGKGRRGRIGWKLSVVQNFIDTREPVRYAPAAVAKGAEK